MYFRDFCFANKFIAFVMDMLGKTLISFSLLTCSSSGGLINESKCWGNSFHNNFVSIRRKAMDKFFFWTSQLKKNTNDLLLLFTNTNVKSRFVFCKKWGSIPTTAPIMWLTVPNSSQYIAMHCRAQELTWGQILVG